MISALLKKMGVKKIICRESSSIHLTTLNAIGISETINPEWESAQVLAQRLALEGVMHLFNISDTLKIIDMVVPLSFVGQKFSPVSFKEETHLKIVALKRNEKILYSSSQPVEDADREDLYFEPYDILVLIGDIRDIRKFLKS